MMGIKLMLLQGTKETVEKALITRSSTTVMTALG